MIHAKKAHNKEVKASGNHRGSGNIKGSMHQRVCLWWWREATKAGWKGRGRGMSHAWGQRMTSVGEICDAFWLKAQGIISWKGSKSVQVFDFEIPCLSVGFIKLYLVTSPVSTSYKTDFSIFSTGAIYSLHWIMSFLAIWKPSSKVPTRIKHALNGLPGY